MLPVGRDRQHDQAREALAQVELVQRAGGERLDHEVRVLEQGQDLGVARLSDHGPLRAAQELEECAVLALQVLVAGRPASKRVALATNGNSAATGSQQAAPKFL